MDDFAPTLIDAPFPSASSYTPKTEHESATPSTFFGTKEVLYAELGSSDIYVNKQDVDAESTWVGFLGEGAADATEEQEESEQAEEFVASQWFLRRGVHGFVGSGALTIIPSSPSPNGVSSPDQLRKAISIPYPSISIHAIRNLSPLSTTHVNGITPQNSAIYLQIEMTKGIEREDQDENTVEVVIVPTSSETSNGDAVASNKAKVAELYDALCACAELHPDPLDVDEPSAGSLGGLMGGADMPAFGAGGWITSENAHEFEGEFPVDVDGEEGVNGHVEDETEVLGPGAGSRRAREEDGEDETKWQRTG